MKNTSNKLFKIILFGFLSFNIIHVNGQISTIIPADRLPDGGTGEWINAGSPVLTTGITVKECINVTEQGVIPTSDIPPYYQTYDPTCPNSDIINLLIKNITFDENNPEYTILYFPEGTYYFPEPIGAENCHIENGKAKCTPITKNGVILKGAGSDKTLLFFHMPSSIYKRKGCIEIYGKNCGIEDLKIRQHLTYAENFTIRLNSNSENCWVRGVESELTNRFHIGIYGNKNTISGCYFHDAHSYGDAGGEAYGICLSGSSEHNLIENNIFRHLRHSMVLQAEPKYNVIGYNYSSEPHGFNYPGGTEIEYSSCLSDLLFHGRYFGEPPNDTWYDGPQYNLIEGNICEKIRLDKEHKSNGPNNTFFRNWAKHEYTCTLGIKAFSMAQVSGDDNKDKQYKQNIVACHAMPSNADWSRICHRGFYAYWYTGHCYGFWEGDGCHCLGSLDLTSDWQDIKDYPEQASYYKLEIPDFWLSDLPWPFYPNYEWLNDNDYYQGRNPAKYRYDSSSPKVVYAGWDLYENMCGPCIFDQGIDITETPALQHNFTATEYITASYAIPDAEPVTFAAGQYIELNPGFETYENGTFEAYIDPSISCDFCNKMLMGDYYPGAQDHSTKESPKQKPEKEKTENKNYTVFESHPNPFNNSTQIIFSIQETTNVRLYITSIYGIEVLELVNNELSKGIHNINIKGSALSSGIYYCILETKDSRRHIKLVKM